MSYVTTDSFAKLLREEIEKRCKSDLDDAIMRHTAALQEEAHHIMASKVAEMLPIIITRIGVDPFGPNELMIKFPAPPQPSQS